VRFAAPGEWPGNASAAASSTGVMTLVPLATPVSVAGVSLRQMPALAKLLAPLGLQPMPMMGGGGAPASGANSGGSAMQPGGAFGVSLATGDLDLTAIGTLTYRKGSKVVGFGHPFTGIGAIDAPMYSAYIHDVLPSFNISQKLGLAGASGRARVSRSAVQRRRADRRAAHHGARVH
jgi:hypothetical protein